MSENGEVLLRGVGGALRQFLILGEVTCPCVQWRPEGLTIRTNKWFLGARFPRSTSHLSYEDIG